MRNPNPAPERCPSCLIEEIVFETHIDDQSTQTRILEFMDSVPHGLDGFPRPPIEAMNHLQRAAGVGHDVPLVDLRYTGRARFTALLQNVPWPVSFK